MRLMIRHVLFFIITINAYTTLILSNHREHYQSEFERLRDNSSRNSTCESLLSVAVIYITYIH